jgi:hypothetical protein
MAARMGLVFRKIRKPQDSKRKYSAEKDKGSAVSGEALVRFGGAKRADHLVNPPSKIKDFQKAPRAPLHAV